MLAFENLIPAKVVDRAVFRRGHEPGAWPVRDARLRPRFERRDESVLREFLGKADVAHDARKAGDDSGRLDSPDCVNRAMCVSSRHGYPSHHLQFARASPDARQTNYRFAAIRIRGKPYPLGANSSGPKIWRISVSPSHPDQCCLCSSMKRSAPSIASSLDFKSKIAYPPMTSLASVNGPSISVSCPRESRTRVLAAVGASPPLATIVPALTASRPSLSIASIKAWGGRPELSEDLTIIMNRIVTSPLIRL